MFESPVQDKPYVKIYLSYALIILFIIFNFKGTVRKHNFKCKNDNARFQRTALAFSN